MANEYVRMNLTLEHNPGVHRVARHLLVDPAFLEYVVPGNGSGAAISRSAATVLTIGALRAVWTFAQQRGREDTAEQIESLAIAGMAPDELEDIIGIPGIAGALQAAGWLIVTDIGIEFPRLLEHGTNLAGSQQAAHDQKIAQRRWALEKHGAGKGPYPADVADLLSSDKIEELMEWGRQNPEFALIHPHSRPPHAHARETRTETVTATGTENSTGTDRENGARGGAGARDARAHTRDSAGSSESAKGATGSSGKQATTGKPAGNSGGGSQRSAKKSSGGHKSRGCGKSGGGGKSSGRAGNYDAASYDFSDWPPDVESQHIDEWLRNREALNKPVTQTAIDDIGAQLKAATQYGWSSRDAMVLMVTKSWQAFQAAWLPNHSAAAGSNGRVARHVGEARAESNRRVGDQAAREIMGEANDEDTVIEGDVNDAGL